MREMLLLSYFTAEETEAELLCDLLRLLISVITIKSLFIGHSTCARCYSKQFTSKLI